MLCFSGFELNSRWVPLILPEERKPELEGLLSSARTPKVKHGWDGNESRSTSGLWRTSCWAFFMPQVCFRSTTLSSCAVTEAGIEKVLNSLQTTGKQQVSNRKIFICATSAALLSRGLITSAKHNNDKKRNLKVVQYWGNNLWYRV